MIISQRGYQESWLKQIASEVAKRGKLTRFWPPDEKHNQNSDFQLAQKLFWHFDTTAVNIFRFKVFPNPTIISFKRNKNIEQTNDHTDRCAPENSYRMVKHNSLCNTMSQVNSIPNSKEKHYDFFRWYQFCLFPFEILLPMCKTRFMWVVQLKN